LSVAFRLPDEISSVLHSCSTLSSRFIRCVLIVAAWQSPLPFCHSHGTLATSTAAAAPWLADHLRACHAAVDPLAQCAFGWHLHFALPDAGDQAPDEPRPIRQQFVVTAGAGSWDSFTRLQSLSIVWGCGDTVPVFSGALVVQSSSDARCGGGFFGDFAPDMPLPLRLGVLRC
jgi:hypothetical protein